jgi:hypothetical protein
MIGTPRWCSYFWLGRFGCFQHPDWPLKVLKSFLFAFAPACVGCCAGYLGALRRAQLFSSALAAHAPQRHCCRIFLCRHGKQVSTYR